MKARIRSRWVTLPDGRTGIIAAYYHETVEVQLGTDGPFVFVPDIKLQTAHPKAIAEQIGCSENAVRALRDAGAEQDIR